MNAGTRTAAMRTLVVDRHAVVRQGLRFLLPQLADGKHVEVLEAGNRADALGHLERHADIALVLLDVRLAGGGAFVEELLEARPQLPVVITAAEVDQLVVCEAFARGALGVLPKSSTPQVIVAALRLVLSGGTYIPPEVMSSRRLTTRSAATREEREVVLRKLGITPRQSQVLALLAEGKSNKAISREMKVAEGTVKNHVAAVLRALRVGTRLEALIAAGRLGLK